MVHGGRCGPARNHSVEKLNRCSHAQCGDTAQTTMAGLHIRNVHDVNLELAFPAINTATLTLILAPGYSEEPFPTRRHTKAQLVVPGQPGKATSLLLIGQGGCRCHAVGHRQRWVCLIPQDLIVTAES